ncbi:hypothetical protein HY632_02165 [Candidatus Uhrbacteria bacterium]|nr:hypothetical protein [Candidatus Uhrbacteria bacterium]
MPGASPEHIRGLERVDHALDRRDHDAASSATVERLADRPAVSAPAIPPPVPAAQTTTVTKSPLREEIELALADDRLRKLYTHLAPAVQASFREAASRLAERIERMLASGKLDLHDLHDGITNWLRVIPRVNHWFLLQEAKVKTDAILAILAKQESLRS